MKFLGAIVSVLLSILILNCSDDSTIENEPEDISELVFSLNVDSNTADTDNWIIVQNDCGELIDFKAYENGDALEIEAESTLVTDNMAITISSYNGEAVDAIYVFGTYPEIEKGSVWNLNSVLEPINNCALRGEEDGSYDVTITNIPIVLGSQLAISNDFGGDGGGGGSGVGTTTYTSIRRYTGADENMISSIGPDGVSRYVTFEKQEAGSILNLDYNQFNEFDSYVNVNVPSQYPYFSAVFGFEGGEGDVPYNLGGGFYLNLTYPFDNSYPPGLGYLNRFQRYYTTVSFSAEDFYYSFKKFGEKPTAINTPENPSITISNSSMATFILTTSFDFKRRINSGAVSEGTRNEDLVETIWTINSPNANQPVVGTIPQELLDLYPEIKINDSTYSSSLFFLNNETYSEVIGRRFLSAGSKSPFISEELISFF